MPPTSHALASATQRARRIADEVLFPAAQTTDRAPLVPRARLDALGVTGPSFIGIHCVHLDAADIALMAAHGCHAVHCPTSNMKLASGAAPIAGYLDAGINVALGTDSVASNNRLDVVLPQLRKRQRPRKAIHLSPAAQTTLVNNPTDCL